MKKDAEAVSACIRHHLDAGKDQDQAIAICLAMDEAGTADQYLSAKKKDSMMEIKAIGFDDSQVDMVERTFKGYASTFGNVDEVGDIIEAGSFAKSIMERGPNGTKQIKVLWQHDAPLGMPTVMQEDSKGLYVEAKISKTRLGDEALELMRDGVVDRMSIGFSIPQGKAVWDESLGVRKIKEVKLFEFSPVTFPANEMAVVTGVKNLQLIRQLASGGKLSKEELKALADILPELQALVDAGAEMKIELDLTPATEEPLMVEDLMKSIADFGTFAKHKLY
jgi:HK97 family phage prohead protease